MSLHLLSFVLLGYLPFVHIIANISTISFSMHGLNPMKVAGMKSKELTWTKRLLLTWTLNKKASGSKSGFKLKNHTSLYKAQVASSRHNTALIPNKLI